MRLCPKCTHLTKEIQRVVKDKTTEKHWLITQCSNCQFNYDLEEFTDKTTGQEEMDKYTHPSPPLISKPWYGY